MEVDNKYNQKIDLINNENRKGNPSTEIKKQEIHEIKKESKEQKLEERNIRDGVMEIKEASETAKEKLAEALNKKANTVVSVSKEGDNWKVVIEIVDEEYLPGKNLDSMSDIIGVYEVNLSDKGVLLSWSKKSSRKRGNTSI